MAENEDQSKSKFQSLIHDFLREYMDAGYRTQLADVVCQCGGRVFSLAVDEVVGEACWICEECESAYLLHDVEGQVNYEGSREADLEDCVCSCHAEQFEVAVGVTLYGDSETARTAYIGCGCTTCGCIACYGSWPRVDLSFTEFFSNMKNCLPE